MRRRRYCWTGCFALMTTLTVVLVIGRAGAQTSTPGIQWQQPAGAADEISPHLFSSPDGQVFRLWQRAGDLRTGGGGFFLAVASPDNSWRKVLELLPKEAGVNAIDPGIGFGPSDEIAVAYQWRRHSPRTKQVRLTRSLDAGKTWTQLSLPIESSGKGFTPKPAWGHGHNLVVTWADERRVDKAWDVYVRRSPDGGNTWEQEQLLSRFPRWSEADAAVSPEILSDGQDRFWIVWMGLRNGRSSYYLSRSSDGGRTWTDPLSLTGQSLSVYGQRFVRAGERFLLVWQDTVAGLNRTGLDRIYAASSTDGGVTWSPPVYVAHLTPDVKVAAGSPAVVLAQDGEAFGTWQDGRNGRDDIFVGRSLDGGRTWGPEDVRLDADEPGTAISRFPSMARAEDGRLAIAWEDDRAGHEGIYLRIRPAGRTSTWGPELLVVPPVQKKAARTPSIVWGRGGALYVAWQVWDFEPGPSAVTRKVDSRVIWPDKK